MFAGRTLLIATKHKKETVIAPILEQSLGVRCVVPEDFDTDLFGTFSGEIERVGDALTTAKNKCVYAMARYNCDLAISSEGSFGPHPHLHFVPADSELLLLLDKKNNLEIAVHTLSAETNFYSQQLSSIEELKRFAEVAKFPAHAVILKDNKDNFKAIVKGICDWDTLYRLFDTFKSQYGSAFIETDMRACYNPSRLKVIEQATHRLVEKINSCCPKCSTPGFDVAEIIRGLLCRQCGTQTTLPLSYLYRCKRCEYEERLPIEELADPMYCDYCNP
jgi:hypothetical protein